MDNSRGCLTFSYCYAGSGGVQEGCKKEEAKEYGQWWKTNFPTWDGSCCGGVTCSNNLNSFFFFGFLNGSKIRLLMGWSWERTRQTEKITPVPQPFNRDLQIDGNGYNTDPHLIKKEARTKWRTSNLGGVRRHSPHKVEPILSMVWRSPNS